MEQCQRCWSTDHTGLTDGVCTKCVTKLTSAPRTLEWAFRYRAYRKKRCIQLKPWHDKSNHFSIIWTKQKDQISQDQFDIMDGLIRMAIAANKGILHFRVIRACKNCTYGRFDAPLEELILDLRKSYPLCADKDLTLDDPKHQFLKETEPWDAEHPIMHHIHSASTNERWKDFMSNASLGSVLTMHIAMEPTE